MLPAPFLGTPSAMAKSADDIARPLNVSDLDNSALADRTPLVITSRTAACVTQRELALLVRASWKQGHSKQSVITSMLINSRWLTVRKHKNLFQNDK